MLKRYSKLVFLALLFLFTTQISIAQTLPTATAPLTPVTTPATTPVPAMSAVTSSPATLATQSSPNQPAIIPASPNLNAKAYVLMDANSGKVLAQKNMNQRVAPASLTKLMTLYLTFQALQTGSIKLTDNVQISKKAWQMGGSKMFVRVGSQVSVEDLIQGVIVDSGNDACVALSEFVGGSEDAFASMMNQQAQLLGMNDSHFVDSTGLPITDHYTTPYDLAILSRAIITNFPQYYHYFGQKWFKYNNISQPNRNRLLWRFDGADGLKTGHTDEAGFCLIGSALKNGMRLISVVMGTPTDEARANESIRLLTYGYRFYNSTLIYQAGNAVATPRVWFGSPKTVPAGLAQDLYVTSPIGQFQNFVAEIQTTNDLKAPIKKGDQVGTITISSNDQQIESAPLIALSDVDKGGFFRHSIDHFEHLLHLFFGGKNTTKKITVTTTDTAQSPAVSPIKP